MLSQGLQRVCRSPLPSNSPDMGGDITLTLLIERRQKGGGQFGFHHTFDKAGKTQQTSEPPDLVVRELRQLRFRRSHCA